MATTQTIPEFFGKHPMFFGKQALIFMKQTLFSRMQKIRLRNSALKFGKRIACFRRLILQMKRAEWTQKRKGKCLSRRRLPFYITEFQLFCLFFDSSLRSSQTCDGNTEG